MYLCTSTVFFNITEISLLGVTVSPSIIDTEELSKDSIPSSSFILSLELDKTGSPNEDTPFTSILFKGH